MQKPSRSMTLGLLITLAVLLGGWIAWSDHSYKKTPQPTYDVVEVRDGYEIRRYDPMIVASTTVGGNYRQSLNSGFLVLADYIFGNNKGGNEVAMTAPVTEQTGTSIAMTAPVTEQTADNERTISFVVPKEYTLDTLPEPNTDQITFTEIPETTRAALRFDGWYATNKRIEQAKQDLVTLLERDGVEFSEAPLFAGYNDPRTFPLMMRNEVQIILNN